MTYVILNISKLTAKEKNPPRAPHQFLWSGTNRTCSIKHESFPLRRRQDATRVHKNIRKEKLGEEDSSLKQNYSSPGRGVLLAEATCGVGSQG